MRARFSAGDEVVLEQWVEALERLTVDSCRVKLLPSVGGGGQAAPAGGTLLVCRFFVPEARQAVKVLIGLSMLVFGLGFVIGVFFDARAGAGGRVLLGAFGTMMAIVGVLGLLGTRPRSRRSQQYVLSWLERVVAAGAEPGTPEARCR